MQAPAIRVRGLRKRYGDFEAVRGLEIEVATGELFGVLGPNGAGKTTTLMILAGLLEPTSGEVEVAGYRLATEPLEAKRRLGYVPDRPYIYEKLTGREVMRLFGDLYDLESERIDRLSREWLATFDLAAKADQLVESYSHGMKQRLVLAATLMHDPEVLVVDEPMVGLDPAGARLLKNLMRERCDRGRTVLMSTHTLQVAEETCDRIAIIDRGCIVAHGSIDDLRRQLARDGASLEEIFLAMTGAAPDGVDRLESIR
jgi:ABC-2 type transport system ATP-binding protein